MVPNFPNQQDPLKEENNPIIWLLSLVTRLTRTDYMRREGFQFEKLFRKSYLYVLDPDTDSRNSRRTFWF